MLYFGHFGWTPLKKNGKKMASKVVANRELNLLYVYSYIYDF